MKTTTVAGVVRCFRVLWVGSMLYDQNVCVDHAFLTHLAMQRMQHAGLPNTLETSKRCQVWFQTSAAVSTCPV